MTYLLPTPISQISLRLRPHPQNPQNHIIIRISLRFLPLLFFRLLHRTQIPAQHNSLMFACGHAEQARRATELWAQVCGRRHPVKTRCLLLLTEGVGRSHGFRGADKILSRLEVEEVEVLEFVVFGRFENVHRNTINVTVFVGGVEEIK